MPVAEARADVALLVDAQALALVQIRREIRLPHDPPAEPEPRAGPHGTLLLGSSGSAVSVDRILIGRYVTVAVSERAAVIVKLAVKVIVLERTRRRFRPRMVVLGYVKFVRDVIRVVAVRTTVNCRAVGPRRVAMILAMIRRIRTDLVCACETTLNARFSLP